MSTYALSLKTARMTAVRDAVDAGPAAGVLKIYTAGFALLLASLTLQKPSFSVDGDHLDLLGLPADTDADATGTAAIARIEDSTGTTKINNISVGVDTGEIRLNSVNVQEGLAVTILGGTITHAP